MAFDPVDLVEDQDQLKAHLVEFSLWPQAWKSCSVTTTLTWKRYKLNRGNSPRVPTLSGIYSLVVVPRLVCHPACSYLMYIGQATNLRTRFHQYLTTERRVRPNVVRLLHKWGDYVVFCFCRVPPRHLTTVEEGLIGAFLPPVNSKFPGKLRAVARAF